jgi:hypothetical protein
MSEDVKGATYSPLMQSTYEQQTARMKSARQQMMSEASESFTGLSRSSGSDALGSRLTNFLSLLESRLSGDAGEGQSRPRYGSEHYERAGSTDIKVTDRGRFYHHGGYDDNHINRGEDISAHDNARIKGGEKNDVIRLNDNGTVSAAEGHDTVRAYHNATLFLGEGNDYASAGNNSRIDGGGGDDMIFADKNAQLFGGSGNDYIGSKNNATIDGGSGNDRIYTINNSVIKGGTGDDYVRMGDRSTLLFNRGDGWDVLESQQKSTKWSGSLNSSTVAFGEGITREDIDIVRRGPHLMIGLRGTEDALVIRNVDTSDVPELEFTDGTKMSPADIQALTRVDDSPLDERLKTAGNKKIIGTSADEYLSHMHHAEVWAGGGNDKISVASESTVHFGRGSGNDTLTGAYSWGAGQLPPPTKIGETASITTISAENASGRLDTSRVLLDDNITPDDVTFTFEGNNLIIGIKGTDDTLTVPEMGRIEDPSHRRPKQVAPNIEFADGTYLSSADVMAKAGANPASK